jgi:iron-sulfur cluster repair protein YtfE (RIC family)
MTQTLPQVGHEHHERLLVQIDRIPAIADQLLVSPFDQVRPSIDDLNGFLGRTLLPHVEASERTIYPELERMYQNRHSMTPMRREHEEVRRMVAALASLTDEIESGHRSVGRTVSLRRILFQLYALLKIHLAEEEAYLRIVNHGVDADAADLLGRAMDHPGIGAS